MKHFLVFGTSEPQDFQIYSNQAALVGTGLTVAIVFRESGISATAAWLDQAAGTVRVTGAEAIPAGTYRARFKLTDGASKFGYVPDGEQPDTWVVAAL